MLAHRLNPTPDLKTSRRAFLVGGAAATGALVVGAYLGLTRGAAVAADGPPIPNGPARPDAFIRIAPDNTVTVLDQAPRHGAGQHDGPRHPRRRRARRRLVAGAHRVRAGRLRALQQPAVRPRPGHRRLHRHRQFLDPDAQGGRGREGDAPRRRRLPVEGAGFGDPGREGRGLASALRPPGHLRRARGKRLHPAGAAGAEAQGAEGLGPYRQARAAGRFGRQDGRLGGVLPRHPPPRHADGGGGASAPVRGDREVRRRGGGAQGAGRRRRGHDPDRRRRSRPRHLLGPERPGGAGDRLGRSPGPRSAPPTRSWPSTRRSPAPAASSPRTRATRAAPSPAPPRCWRRSSSSPTSPTPPWSR